MSLSRGSRPVDVRAFDPYVLAKHGNIIPRGRALGYRLVVAD
jgi:hypothetical protein